MIALKSLTQVAIYTDGMGTYQARCMGCSWRGRWFRAEAKAVKQAGTHNHGGGA